jgi:hypothetical protein
MSVSLLLSRDLTTVEVDIQLQIDDVAAWSRWSIVAVVMLTNVPAQSKTIHRGE